MWSLDSHYQVYKSVLEGKIKFPAPTTHFLTLLETLEQQQLMDSRDYPLYFLEELKVDPELCQLIINSVNANRFYGGSTVDSLEQALQHQSPAQVAESVWLYAIRNLVLTEDLPVHHLNRRLWEDALQMASVCRALNARLSKDTNFPSHQSALAGVLFHIGTIMLISCFRDRNMALPSSKEVEQVPSTMAANMASIAVEQWGLSNLHSECAMQRNQYQEVSHGAFDLVDVFHMAAVHHLNHHKERPNVVRLKDSLPFIKAVKHKLIREEAEHFTQMINGHALIIYRGFAPLVNKFPISLAANDYTSPESVWLNGVTDNL